jgi:hypothetical protein
MVEPQSRTSFDSGGGDFYFTERVLNAAITSAEIAESLEEYLRIFEAFYADEIELSIEGRADPVCGKSEVRALLNGFLLPVHVMVEIGGLSISIRKTAVLAGAGGEAHSAWTLELVGTTRETCSLSWRTLRKWKQARVVHERHYEHRWVGGPLSWRDICGPSTSKRSEGFQRPS